MAKKPFNPLFDDKTFQSSQQTAAPDDTPETAGPKDGLNLSATTAHGVFQRCYVIPLPKPGSRITRQTAAAIPVSVDFKTRTVLPVPVE